MIYTIQLNGEKYGIDVGERVAHIVGIKDMEEFEDIKDDFSSELPDFDFSGNLSCGSIYI